jgi:N,N'-diacetyllegionaminate synthase
MKTFIIAEAGVNHNGSIEIAKKLIDIAKEAGADAIKFQTFKAEKLVSRVAPKAEYQKGTTDKEESQLNMLKKLELDAVAHRELIKYCKKKRIIFLSTPFDFESIDLLNTLDIKIFKIPSGEITNLPYLKKIGSLKKKIIMSTGIADLGEIEDALEILIKAGTKKEDITVLHCNTEYPTPFEDVNLFAMLTIKEAFKVNVGYSDHTSGIEVPIAAVALSASVIEKHFTLDKNMEGPDHKASLEPDELKTMVQAIRNIEKALGNGIKSPSQSELKNKPIARKSIVAVRSIMKGEMFSEKNITTKRPGTGISPVQWDKILGKRAKRNFKEDELIEI